MKPQRFGLLSPGRNLRIRDERERSEGDGDDWSLADRIDTSVAFEGNHRTNVPLISDLPEWIPSGRAGELSGSTRSPYALCIRHSTSTMNAVLSLTRVPGTVPPGHSTTLSSNAWYPPCVTITGRGTRVTRMLHSVVVLGAFCVLSAPRCCSHGHVVAMTRQLVLSASFPGDSVSAHSGDRERLHDASDAERRRSPSPWCRRIR